MPGNTRQRRLLPGSSLLGLVSRVITFITVVPLVVSAHEHHQKGTDAPLPPLKAAATMQVPEGFRVSLFAGEPDVTQPVAFCIDDRSRLWVCEAQNYPKHGDSQVGDRIVIFDDIDNDGKFDTKTVFYDQLNYVTGIEVGFGGVWVMSPPYFYFIRDRDRDDVPDGKPEVLLDGFGNHANSHNLANGFAWGPDGWLYGTHGRTNFSDIGKPGTTQEERVRFDGGVWRYHPVKHIWEPFCDGTTNPWGIDWNDHGQAFITNCVNPHLFHAIQGAHYEPWRGRKSSEFAYRRIETIADHLHYVEGDDVRERLGTEAVLEKGGGHAHCGSMIYLGDSFPDKYRNTVFLNNIHGKRINNERLSRQGSGYTASHEPDFMIAKDSWYMGVNLRTGPDGSVFATDWSDTGECHSVKNTQKHTGRIYKISYGKPKQRTFDLRFQSSRDLVKLHLHKNDWHVRHARRLLMERSLTGERMAPVHLQLKGMFESSPDITRKLRALWTLHALNAIDEEFLRKQLNHESEHIRAWAIRLISEVPSPAQDSLQLWARMAREDDSALVRLHLCSAVRRLDPKWRWDIVTALASRKEDADDQNIPLMLWYAAEPLVHEDPRRFLRLGLSAQIPLLREHIARRLTEKSDLESRFTLLTSALIRPGESRADFLQGMLSGLTGTRDVAMPSLWPKSFAAISQSDDETAIDRATRLGLLFGDPEAEKQLYRTAENQKGSLDARRTALTALLQRAPVGLDEKLIHLLREKSMRPLAIRGLANYQHPDTAAELLSLYHSLSPPEKQDALLTLSSRPDWALNLLHTIETGAIARTDLTAYTARQLQNLNHREITEIVKQQWGELRKTPAEKEKLIASYRKRLPPDSIASASRENGRVHYQKLCASCHQMFGEGGNAGPELTGSQRTNLDYLLENILDPSSSVSKDYQLQIVETTNGRTLAGFVASENDQSLTLQAINEAIVIPKNEIKKQVANSTSLMPEGLLQSLSTAELKELIAYLSSPHQVPLPGAE